MKDNRNGNIRNVIFDLGGVLLDWSPERLLAGFTADPQTRALYREAVLGHPDWLALDKGLLTEAEGIERFRARTGRPAAEVAGFMQAVRDFLQPIRPTVDLLQELADRGVPLYCLSNMSGPIFSHVRGRNKFFDRFQGIVVSGLLKMKKPEPEIYRYLLSRYGLQADTCVFIDDILANLESARGIGLQTILFQGAADCRQRLNLILGLEVP